MSKARWAEFVTEYENLDEVIDVYVLEKQTGQYEIKEYPIDKNKLVDVLSIEETLKRTICYEENMNESDLVNPSTNKVQLYEVDLSLLPDISGVKRKYVINIVSGKLYSITNVEYEGKIYHTPQYAYKNIQPSDPVEEPVSIEEYKINFANITSSSVDIVVTPTNDQIERYVYSINGTEYNSIQSSYTLSNLLYDQAYTIFAKVYQKNGELIQTKEVKLWSDLFSDMKTYFASYDESNAYKVFDGKTSTSWDGKSTQAYVGCKYSIPRKVKSVKISQPYTKSVIKDFKIQYSDDGNNYLDASDMLTFSISSYSSPQTFNLRNDIGAHTYWRYKNSTVYNNYTTYCGISELTFDIDPNGWEEVYYLNRTIGGQYSSNKNTENLYKAFDNLDSTYWDGGNTLSYITYDFNEPVECNAISISQPYTKSVIKDFIVQYSDDGINYIDASDTLTFSIVECDSTQIFNLNSNLGKHKYWRYQNLTLYNNYTAYCGISELNFMYKKTLNFES